MTTEIVSVTITRPANTTLYTALDVIGDTAGSAINSIATTYAVGALRRIVSTRLRLDITALPSGMTTFRVHLYSGSPTAIVDNAAFDLPVADRALYLGYVTLTAPVDLGATLWSQDTFDPTTALRVIPAGATVYCILQTVGSFTPAANSEVYKLTLELA